MSMKSLTLSLVTPERTLFSGSVLEATLSTEAGEVTILPDHVPYIATLKPGEIFVRKEDGSEESFVVFGGFVEFHANALTVLADAAERADEIDVENAEKAIARAREIREQKVDPQSEEYLAAIALLERSWARLSVAKKRRSHTASAPESIS
ncbi:MAG: ATP synthase F1 subunit epsilon [Candidatus Moraniibacteriota bacterium]|nr:MAG: ATP synthase F1 subunit epsilon [Candidatus Moranbacteria bacterium]